MTAEEIRQWSEKVEKQHPEHHEKAKIRIMYEIAAQLAELNQFCKSIYSREAQAIDVRVTQQ